MTNFDQLSDEKYCAAIKAKYEADKANAIKDIDPKDAAAKAVALAPLDSKFASDEAKAKADAKAARNQERTDRFTKLRDDTVVIRALQASQGVPQTPLIEAPVLE